jgi:PAS domain S-box-containing protein
VRNAAGQIHRIVGVARDITKGKRAEAALRESNQRFRAIFTQAAVGLAQTDLDGKWLLLNDRFCEITGYTQAELRGKTFLDITHPADREASLAKIRRLLAGEISSNKMEKRYIRKDGAIVWVTLSTSLVRDQDNQPQYFTSVAEDITDRVRAERALRESEGRLALAQNAARLGIWDSDLTRGITTFSGEYAKLYGLAPDHPPLTHNEWLGLIHPDDRERVRGSCASVSSGRMSGTANSACCGRTGAYTGSLEKVRFSWMTRVSRSAWRASARHHRAQGNRIRAA